MKEIGEEGVLLVAEWVRHGQHQRAQHLRDGGFDAPDTYLRAAHRGEYLDLAMAWRQDGPATKPARLNGISPGAAWDLVLRGLRTNGWRVPPDGWHPNPEIHRACVAGLEAVGGVHQVGQSEERELPHIGRRFAAAFGEAYHGA